MSLEATSNKEEGEEEDETNKSPVRDNAAATTDVENPKPTAQPRSELVVAQPADNYPKVSVSFSLSLSILTFQLHTN